MQSLLRAFKMWLDESWAGGPSISTDCELENPLEFNFTTNNKIIQKNSKNKFAVKWLQNYTIHDTLVWSNLWYNLIWHKISYFRSVANEIYRVKTDKLMNSCQSWPLLYMQNRSDEFSHTSSTIIPVVNVDTGWISSTLVPCALKHSQHARRPLDFLRTH